MIACKATLIILAEFFRYLALFLPFQLKNKIFHCYLIILKIVFETFYLTRLHHNACGG